MVTQMMRMDGTEDYIDGNDDGADGDDDCWNCLSPWRRRRTTRPACVGWESSVNNADLIVCFTTVRTLARYLRPATAHLQSVPLLQNISVFLFI